MGGGGGKTPSMDYMKNLQGQGEDASKQAAEWQTQQNRPDQSNPWGNITWTQNPDGSWKQDTSLNEGTQGIWDKITGAAGGTQLPTGPMDWGQFGGVPGAVTAPGMGDFAGPAQGPQFNTDYQQVNWQDLANLGNAGAGQASAERAKEYELQKQLDMSGLSDLAQADPETRQRVEDALYQRFQSRLDPQWQQRESALLDRMYATGAREGDQLFGQQFGDLGRERNDAYNQAMWQSIVGGGEEMQRLFDMEMANRQQTWQEALGQGQFTNDALMNQFQQGAFNAGQANQVGMANAANQTQANIASAGNRLQGAGMGLDYGLRSANQANQWGQQGWENQMTGNQFWNDLVQQGYGNQRQQWQDTTAARDQQIQEALMERGMGQAELGGYMDLLGGISGNLGGGFSDFALGGGYEAADPYAAYWDRKSFKSSKDAAKNQAIMQGVGTAASMALMFSDRRLKSNIVRVGSTPAGYGVYEYDIFGQRQRGVMADEVPAEWTVPHASGYLMVDYSKVK